METEVRRWSGKPASEDAKGDSGFHQVRDSQYESGSSSSLVPDFKGLEGLNLWVSSLWSRLCLGVEG